VGTAATVPARQPQALWPVAGSPAGDRRDYAPGSDPACSGVTARTLRAVEDRLRTAPAVVGRRVVGRLLQQVQAAADAAGEIDWEISEGGMLVDFCFGLGVVQAA